MTTREMNDRIREIQEYMNTYIDDINLSNYDKFYKRAVEAVDNHRSYIKRNGILDDNNEDLIEQPNRKLKNMASDLKKEIPQEKPKMVIVGNDNAIFASEFVKYYRYNVKVKSLYHSDVMNKELTMNNGFFSKLFKTPAARFSFIEKQVFISEITIIFKPISSIEYIDGVEHVFSPFKVLFSTDDCYDGRIFVDNSNKNIERLNMSYILNDQLLSDKFTEIMTKYKFSKNAKINIADSIDKKLKGTQSIRYYDLDNWEELPYITSDTIDDILFDNENGELLASLSEYLD